MPDDGFFGKVGKGVGIDILMAATKNSISASKSGTGFLLVWQVGFATDMAGIALEKNIKALNEGIVFMNAENEMYTSFFNGAIQAKSGYDKANIIQNLLNTSGASQQEKQIYTDKIIKYRKIAEESADVLAEKIKSYYIERGNKLYLTNPYDRLDVEDIKSVMVVATAIREDILFRSADSRLTVDGKITRVGKQVYDLLSKVPNQDWSFNDNYVKNQRYSMLRVFLGTFLAIASMPPLVFGVDMEDKLRSASTS